MGYKEELDKMKVLYELKVGDQEGAMSKIENDTTCSLARAPNDNLNVIALSLTDKTKGNSQ